MPCHKDGSCKVMSFTYDYCDWCLEQFEIFHALRMMTGADLLELMKDVANGSLR